MILQKKNVERAALIRWARRKLILDAIEDEALYDDAIDVLIDFG